MLTATPFCKAKRKDNNEWVFGYYCYNPLMQRGEIFSFDNERSYVYIVIPETVEIRIGINDKNNTPIYSGDIVNCKTTSYTFNGFVVEWYAKQCRFIISRKTERYPIDEKFEYEIIGNRTDNPELLL